MLFKLRGDGDGDVAQAGDPGADDDKCRRSLEGGRPRRPLPASTSTCPDPSSTTALPLRPTASKETQKTRKKISEFLRTSVDTGLPSRPRCQQVKQDEPRKRFHKSLQHRLSSPLAESACTATTIRLTRAKAAHTTDTMVDHNLVLSPTSSHRTMVSTGTVCCPLGARCTTGGCHHRVVPGRPRRHATTRATHRPRLTPRNQPGIRDN